MAARYALAAIASAAVASAQFSTSADATSAFWTHTVRYMEQVTETPYTYTYYDNSVTTDTWTATRTIKDGVTPTASPYTAYTSWDYYNENLAIVDEYYTAGVVAESDLSTSTPYDYYSTTNNGLERTTSTSIDFMMPVTMTAPASCPTIFTVTTAAPVYVPTEVTAQISPTSVETSSEASTYGNYVYIFETWYLTEGAAPFTSTSDLTYEYYIASCSTPPADYSYTGYAYPTGSTYDSGNDDDSSGSYYDECYYYSSYYCGSYVRYWIIIVASVIPGLFLLGFLESWLWFRRLMLGKSAMRFGTVCWVLISLFILCFTRMQDRRSPEDQKLLAEKWKNMSSGAAFKAWWKWGFRHKYPEELLGQFSKSTVGIVPPGQPLNPAMAQVPGGFPPGAPGSGAPSTGAPAVPGPVYYYGPPPPGWVQAPNGGFMPPQGYMYPPPPQAGYYGDAAKDGSLVSSSPVSAMGPSQQQQPMSNVSPISPQAPQPVHPAPTPYGAPPNVGPLPDAPPSPPPQGPLPSTPPPATAQEAPQIPPMVVSEPPAENAPKQPATSTAPPQPKNDPNDRSLYE
ncbi:hypothetical protein TW65_01151 [Stemphylium lycopersici]|uniref:Uncharacterized protein n=1 Tax=Stemphylium lycopersici TaxID=183478 RepID=A0A364MVP7_STELY|nr:hypothetical protein TW65_01151 [Stemphylium lycopersici]RAR04921.1 hypothetical protein DDE83_007621 [Stemphylium lycopersici]